MKSLCRRRQYQSLGDVVLGTVGTGYPRAFAVYANVSIAVRTACR